MKIIKTEHPDHSPPASLLAKIKLPEGAFIVGGAARVWSQGGSLVEEETKSLWPFSTNSTIADVDIVYGDRDTMANHIKYFRKNFSLYDKADYGDHVENYTASVRVDGATYEINLVGMFVGDIEYQFSRFDLSPTQVGYDHTGCLFQTEAFLESVETNVMEFINFEDNWATNYAVCKHRYSSDANINAETWRVIYNRVQKYNDKGFESGNSIVMKLLEHS